MGNTTDPGRAEPAVRFSHLKEDVDALAALGPDLQARVLARIDPRVLVAIRESTRVSWADLSLNLEMAEAVLAEAGPSGSRAWGRASFRASLTTFFRPMLEGVASLFDLQPTTILKFAPQAWPAVYRNCGALEIRRDGGERASIVTTGFPPPLLREPFLHALAGTFEGGIEICRRQGQVLWQLDGPTATYQVSWSGR
jgi:hypothetical protein